MHVDTKLHKLKGLSKRFWLGFVRNWSGQSGLGTLKLAVSQEWIDGINWFFACQFKLSNFKSFCDDFGVGVVKNEHGYLLNETLESAVS